MLGLEIEYLLGTAFAAKSEDDPLVDWPPQPDRIFSALVASWGARGNDPLEREALEWLERQESPRILAPGITPRSAPTVFVPPNDFKTSTSGNFDVIPARRRRQARRFPSGHLDDRLLRVVWNSTPSSATRDYLDALARDTAYVGHSSSLTRCRFVEDDFDLTASRAAERIPYAGRLEELERAYRGSKRPGPGFVVVPKPRANDAEIFQSVFSDDWIIFADDRGHVPDLRAVAVVTRKLRDALMGAFDRDHGDVPEWLSGHAPGNVPSKTPHVAIVPLADVAWDHSEGRFMGCAIVMPRTLSPDLLNDAILTLMEQREDGDSNIQLHYGAEAPWYLRPTDTPARASQKVARWIGNRPSSSDPIAVRSARLWTTATPIVLDRFPKERDPDAREAEIADCISRACRNIGLPQPSYVSFEVNSRLRGAPAARARRDAQPWQRWRLPDSLAGRYLTHATVGFDEPVQGPVILGAGRYTGLGLCKPINSASAL